MHIRQTVMQETPISEPAAGHVTSFPNQRAEQEQQHCHLNAMLTHLNAILLREVKTSLK